jgi:hypothetical protein
MEIFQSTATVKEQFPAIHGKGSPPTKLSGMQWFTPFPSIKCQISPHRRKQFMGKLDSQMLLKQCRCVKDHNGFRNFTQNGEHLWAT